MILRRGIAALLAAVVVASGLLFSSPEAAAAPVTVTDPNSGASITLSTDRIAPGQRVDISGREFTPTRGSTGDPLVAVRPYDFDDGPAWTTGGRDSYIPADPSKPPGSEAKYWYVTHHEDGTFEGWLQAPASLTAAGPQGNGRHWLRILSGAFFTSTGDRLTDPITFMVPFTVDAPSASTGLTSPTGVFQAGTTFRPGAQPTLRGEGFTPNTALAVTLDGTTLDSAITVGSDGSLPGTARVTLPTGTSVGQHTLRLATGAKAASVTLRVTAQPTATVRTPEVRRGGTIGFDLAGYIGVGGAPQKVAVVVNEKVLACIQTGSTGAGSGTAVLPAELTGTVVVGFNVGLSCKLPPDAVINDQPISRITSSVTVIDAPLADAALALTAPSPLSYGAARKTTVTLKVDGKAASGNVVVTQGAWKKTVAVGTGGTAVTLPATAKAGKHTVTAAFAGDDLTSPATASRAFTVTKAKSSASLKLSPTKVKRTKRATATVTIKVTGAASDVFATGTVRIYDGKKRLGTYTLKASHKGVLKVTLPKIKKKGSHKVKAVYAGTSDISGKTSSKKKLKVT